MLYRNKRLYLSWIYYRFRLNCCFYPHLLEYFLNCNKIVFSFLVLDMKPVTAHLGKSKLNWKTLVPITQPLQCMAASLGWPPMDNNTHWITWLMKLDTIQKVHICQKCERDFWGRFNSIWHVTYFQPEFKIKLFIVTKLCVFVLWLWNKWRIDFCEQ